MTADKQRFARWQLFAAKRSALKANTLLPTELKGGRILDIGCGFFRNCHVETNFSQKYGLHKGIDRELRMDLKRRHDVALVDIDLEYSARIPFDSSFFDVVTTLGVWEHLGVKWRLRIVQEIERVLKPGGVFIMTTPTKCTKRLLDLFVGLKVLSPFEIRGYKATHSRKQILAILKEGGFPMSSVASGYSELFMNIWVRAKKEPNLFELEEFEPLES